MFSSKIHKGLAGFVRVLTRNYQRPRVYSERELDGRPIPSATCTSQTRDEVPDGTFFLLVSKGFSKAIRLSETGDVAEIGL
jgi:hypothetical protein